MYQSLYRMELSPQQQAQQQNNQASSLPMQRPNQMPQNNGMVPPGGPSMPEEKEQVDIMGKMKESLGKKMGNVEKNRFTSKMTERVGEISANIRAQIESGQITKEEGKQILAQAVGGEFKSVTGWMNGGKGPQNYLETQNPAQTKKYLQENRQAFEKMRDLKMDIAAREEALRNVFDKENPKFQKSTQDLMTMKQKYKQMFEGLKNGMVTGEAYEGNKELQAARGEDTI